MKKTLLALVLGSTLALTACDQAKKTTSEVQAPAAEAPATTPAPAAPATDTPAPATDKAPEAK